jgi:HAE1 family hydrophobic/amphiphilic exporter-1/multidrug efflux pump
VVVGSAVLISAFVSLTITPVLNVVLSRPKAGHSSFYTFTEPFFKGMENGYKSFLTKFIRIRGVAWVIVILCLVLIFGIGTRLQSEIAPLEDKGNIRLQITGPEGASYGYMTDAGKDLGNFLIDSIPEADFSFLQLPGGFGGGGGSLNAGNGRIGLVPLADRNKSQSDIAKDLNRKLIRFKDLRIFATEEQTISVGLGSRGGLPVQFVVQNLDFDKIKEIIPKFLDEAKNDKTFQNVDVNLKFNKPEVDIIINRIKARELGLTVSDIANVIQSAFSGRRLAYFTMNGRQYQVISQVGLKDRQDPVDITKLYVRSSLGNNIALSEVIDIVPNANPPTIYHYNRYKSATISASLSEGHTIGDGVAAMQAIANKLLDESYQTSLSGPSRDYAESSSNTAFAFMLALLLIYLVLAAQFESFKDPFIIMITVPLAIAGAVLSLWIFGHTLNIFSEIGMITLIGLVTKNGILIVEFANQKRGHGLDKFEAVTDAATQRLRPILMTSLATSLGALPIALSLGAASTSRIPLGIVIVGGIVFSLILTLFVIPAIYTFVSGKHVSQEEIDNQFK